MWWGSCDRLLNLETPLISNEWFAHCKAIEMQFDDHLSSNAHGSNWHVASRDVSATAEVAVCWATCSPITSRWFWNMQSISCHLSSRPLKNSNFTDPRWRTAAILKTVKSPYLCSRLTDFDEIWHNDAHWPPIAERPPSGKSQKSLYLPTVRPIFTKFGMLMQNGSLNRPDC